MRAENVTSTLFCLGYRLKGTPTATESQLMCVHAATDVSKDCSSSLCGPMCAPHFLLRSVISHMKLRNLFWS